MDSPCSLDKTREEFGRRDAIANFAASAMQSSRTARRSSSVLGEDVKEEVDARERYDNLPPKLGKIAHRATDLDIGLISLRSTMEELPPVDDSSLSFDYGVDSRRLTPGVLATLPPVDDAGRDGIDLSDNTDTSYSTASRSTDGDDNEDRRGTLSAQDTSSTHHVNAVAAATAGDGVDFGHEAGKDEEEEYPSHVDMSSEDSMHSIGDYGDSGSGREDMAGPGRCGDDDDTDRGADSKERTGSGRDAAGSGRVSRERDTRSNEGLPAVSGNKPFQVRLMNNRFASRLQARSRLLGSAGPDNNSRDDGALADEAALSTKASEEEEELEEEEVKKGQEQQEQERRGTPDLDDHILSAVPRWLFARHQDSIILAGRSPKQVRDRVGPELCTPSPSKTDSVGSYPVASADCTPTPSPSPPPDAHQAEDEHRQQQMQQKQQQQQQQQRNKGIGSGGERGETRRSTRATTTASDDGSFIGRSMAGDEEDEDLDGRGGGRGTKRSSNLSARSSSFHSVLHHDNENQDGDGDDDVDSEVMMRRTVEIIDDGGAVEEEEDIGSNQIDKRNLWSKRTTSPQKGEARDGADATHYLTSANCSKAVVAAAAAGGDARRDGGNMGAGRGENDEKKYDGDNDGVQTSSFRIGAFDSGGAGRASGERGEKRKKGWVVQDEAAEDGVNEGVDQAESVRDQVDGSSGISSWCSSCFCCWQSSAASAESLGGHVPGNAAQEVTETPSSSPSSSPQKYGYLHAGGLVERQLPFGGSVVGVEMTSLHQHGPVDEKVGQDDAALASSSSSLSVAPSAIKKAPQSAVANAPVSPSSPSADAEEPFHAAEAASASASAPSSSSSLLWCRPRRMCPEFFQCWRSCCLG